MEDKIKTLKGRLEQIGTRELLGMISVRFMTLGKDIESIAEQSGVLDKSKLIQF